MTEQPDAGLATGIDHTLRRIRTGAAIAALSTTAIAVVVLLVLTVLLYPSLRRTVENLEMASAAAATTAADFAAISGPTAQNLADTSVNFNEAAVNFNQASENFRQNSLDDSIAATIVQLLTQESGEALR